MKKQNRHPNISQPPNTKRNQVQKNQPTRTLVPFKPRFIVKDASTISCQDINANLQPNR